MFKVTLVFNDDRQALFIFLDQDPPPAIYHSGLRVGPTLDANAAATLYLGAVPLFSITDACLDELKGAREFFVSNMADIDAARPVALRMP